ncbi:TonB C-terminal domain-containing protein [Herbaspirillum huttiense]|uniref:TonB C-terminal domain-containing protein n=1 Tax=Herbaspirillum huttiense TaxID=863372 RepID=UPI0039B024D7
MNQVPVFLHRLGLDGQADERAVRRAYARELKQIDQEQQAIEFQALRESYEAALAWCRTARPRPANDAGSPALADQQGQQRGPSEEATQEPAPPVAAPVLNFAPPKAAVHYRQHEGVNAPPAEPVLPEWIAQAQAQWPNVVSRFEALAGSRQSDHLPSWTSLLRDILAQEAWLDLRARPWLELRIAQLLAQGWRSGHEYLFVAAIEVFEWETDIARLATMGPVGNYLGQAIGQYHHFLEMKPAQVSQSRVAIARLRQPAMPDRREAAELLPVLQPLISRYPEWMHVVTGMAHFEQWRQQGMQMPPSTGAGTSKPAASSGGGGFGGFRGFFLIVFLLGSVARIIGGSSGPAPVAPRESLYQPAPTTFPSVNPAATQYAQGERVTRLIWPHIVYTPPGNLAFNPTVSYRLRLTPTGAVDSLERILSSGLPPFDEAVRKAIMAVPGYPADVPREMVLTFHPLP